MILNRSIWRVPMTVLKSKAIIGSRKQIRCLYSGEELGINKYAASRKVVEHAIVNHKFFKQQFRKQLDNPEYNLTHVEYGLKNHLHIMENNQTDINILKYALKILIHRQSGYEGDKYRFGTIILRTFYFLNIPDTAIEFFEDEFLAQLFTQVTGYQILFDLLYENEKYNDVLRIYENLNKYGRLKQNKYIDVIILATYYRLNSSEALEKALDLWSKMTENERNQVQFRKSRTFVAGLAVKQFKPDLALKILEGETTYVTMRHIKLLAWSQLGQFDKIFEMFRIILNRYNEEKKYNPFTSIEVLDEIKSSVQMKGSPNDINEFKEIHKKIQTLNLLTERTVDDLLCTPFPALPQANIYHKKR